MFRIEGIHTYYGDSHILRGVSLELTQGRAVGLLGRNGMGKTTLIRTLMGYVQARVGKVLADARDVTNYPPEKMARLGIGYVPEGRGVFPNLTVKENLQMSARAGLNGERDWTYDRVMDTFARLKERCNNRGDQLSGGEQQMVSIGRALMTNPRLMILDEATEGLAPLVVKEIWRVIAEIRQAGVSTLIVDRDYKKVLAHTDHAAVMEKGQLVVATNSAQLLAQPEQLAQLLGV
ncbi:ABC transporter ATP-binding protein [Ottowia thiooxydans]|uniref:ABC transporter ATP-binding protein n=1 Tax=Ottowia thiooxydans TaxID=219182 RepID=UPI0004908863|nr:ABC transporter ATP-binding protein [Ottowia thiooxydans]